MEIPPLARLGWTIQVHSEGGICFPTQAGQNLAFPSLSIPTLVFLIRPQAETPEKVTRSGLSDKMPSINVC